MYFQNSQLRKSFLNKSLKSLPSEEPSKSNMLRGTKHSSNLNSAIFTISIDHCGNN